MTRTISCDASGRTLVDLILPRPHQIRGTNDEIE